MQLDINISREGIESIIKTAIIEFGANFVLDLINSQTIVNYTLVRLHVELKCKGA